MEAIIGVAISITVGVSVLLEVVKQTVGGISERYLPLVAMLLGVIVAVVANLIPELELNISWLGLVVAGGIAGLSASGLYDLTDKTVLNRKK
nr:MAG TPA_asm: holin [Caudoviricetes sp.]